MYAPQYYASQYYAPQPQSSDASMYMGILIVVLIVGIFKLKQDYDVANSTSSASPTPTQSSTPSPTPTSAPTSTPTLSVPSSTLPPPVITLFKGVNYTGEKYIVSLKDKVKFGYLEDGVYIPLWKSMKVKPGINVMLEEHIQYVMDGGNTFVFTATKDIPDIRYFLEYELKLWDNTRYYALMGHKHTGGIYIRPVTDTTRSYAANREYNKCVKLMDRHKQSCDHMHPDVTLELFTSSYA